jgi:hypothetical protein
VVFPAYTERVVAANVERVLVNRVITVSVAVPAHGLLGTSSMLTPSMVVAVPVKYCSTKSDLRPTASKIWAPQ